MESKCHSSKLSQWSECSVDVSCGSEWHGVGLCVDVTSRHPACDRKYYKGTTKSSLQQTYCTYRRHIQLPATGVIVQELSEITERSSLEHMMLQRIIYI
jgi:hypothetical protein